MAAIVDAESERSGVEVARLLCGAGRSRGYSRVYPARGDATADEMVQVSAPAASRRRRSKSNDLADDSHGPRRRRCHDRPPVAWEICFSLTLHLSTYF